MSSDVKPTVSKEETFDRLDIRLGRIQKAERLDGAPKAAFRLEIDFGKFGTRVSVGRFTQHSVEQLVGLLVLAVLNFEPRSVGGVTSEVLTLGVQFPKAESGEATPIVPLADAKVGGKLF